MARGGGVTRPPAAADRPTVIVDGAPVRVRPWSTWRDAVTAHDPSRASALRRGDAWIADALGNPLDPGGAVVDGASITIFTSVR